jgi:hypothetical protein
MPNLGVCPLEEILRRDILVLGLARVELVKHCLQISRGNIFDNLFIAFAFPFTFFIAFAFPFAFTFFIAFTFPFAFASPFAFPFAFSLFLIYCFRFYRGRRQSAKPLNNISITKLLDGLPSLSSRDSRQPWRMADRPSAARKAWFYLQTALDASIWLPGAPWLALAGSIWLPGASWLALAGSIWLPRAPRLALTGWILLPERPDSPCQTSKNHGFM